MARYGRQQIWPNGMLEADYGDVVAMADEIEDLIRDENKKPKLPGEDE